MHLQTNVVFGLVLAALAPATVAQEAEFTGVIEPATLPSICQEETHFLTCTGPKPFSPTGVLLKSSTLDLDEFVGQNMKYTAVLRGVTCPIWDVTSATLPSATLVSCGSPVPGCTMRFRVGPTGVIGRYSLFLSFSPDFRPPPARISGTVLLGPPIHVFATGLTFGPTAAFDFTIPPSVSLTGLDIWLQGARQDIGPIGPLEVTNAICFTILGPSPPCISPNC